MVKCSVPTNIVINIQVGNAWFLEREIDGADKQYILGTKDSGRKHAVRDSVPVGLTDLTSGLSVGKCSDSNLAFR